MRIPVAASAPMGCAQNFAVFFPHDNGTFRMDY